MVQIPDFSKCIRALLHGSWHGCLRLFSPAQENVTARAARKGAGISYATENPLNSYYKERWHYGGSQGLRLLKI